MQERKVEEASEEFIPPFLHLSISPSYLEGFLYHVVVGVAVDFLLEVIILQ